MKTIVKILFILSPIILFGQFTKELSINSFTKVQVSQGLKVKFTTSSERNLKITSDNEELLNLIVAEVENDELYIHLKKNSNIKKNQTTIYLTNDYLNRLHVNSGATFIFENSFTTEKLDIDASSGGAIRGDINTDNLEIDCSSGAEICLSVDSKNSKVDISSGGILKISGKISNAKINVGSGGEFDGKELSVKAADLDADSGGEISITVTESINASADSGGTIKYFGEPTTKDIHKDISGSISHKK